MVYKNKFVAEVKCGGKILRAIDDVVYVPFGSEYSILLKNLNTQKALVTVTIDDRIVTDGGIILSPNETLDLERFIDGDLKNGYKFKFIQKTKEIQEHRGDELTDGIIKIEWQWEKTYYDYYLNTNTLFRSNVERGRGWEASGGGSGTFYGGSCDVYCCSVGNAVGGSPINNISEAPLDDEGITVEGGDSNQSFVYGTIGRLETEIHNIVFMLRGVTEDNQKVQKPILVHEKIKCKYCGKKSESSQRFCGTCGARLVK